jgi:Mg-chelatase subunit ChlD
MCSEKVKNKKMKRTIFVGTTIVAAVSFSACADSGFKGTTPKRPGLEAKAASERVLNVACTGNDGVANLVADLSGSARDLVKIEGEFCQLPETEGKSGELDIVFTIDFSGSMKMNDPGTATSCGRLAAATAIHTKLKSSLPAGAKVKVGVVGFDTTAMTKVPMTSLDSFGASLTYANFCSHNKNGYTNYAAAFDATRTILADAKRE